MEKNNQVIAELLRISKFLDKQLWTSEIKNGALVLMNLIALINFPFEFISMEAGDSLSFLFKVEAIGILIVLALLGYSFIRKTPINVRNEEEVDAYDTMDFQCRRILKSESSIAYLNDLSEKIRGYREEKEDYSAIEKDYARNIIMKAGIISGKHNIFIAAIFVDIIIMILAGFILLGI